MEQKRIIIAVIISSVVILIGFGIQSLLSSSDTPNEEVAASDNGSDQPAEEESETENVPQGGDVVPWGDEPSTDAPYTYRNDIVEVVFSPIGGAISSFNLLEHLDEGTPVDMIFSGETGQNSFELFFDDNTNVGTLTSDTVLYHRSPTYDSNVIEFYRDFIKAEDLPSTILSNTSEEGTETEDPKYFTVRKRYRFFPDEYLFELEISIENSVNEYIPLDFNGASYTLKMGPQIGPQFNVLDNRNEYRRYYYYQDGRRRNIRIDRSGIEQLEETPDWVTIVGKYFLLGAVLGTHRSEIVVADAPIEGVPAASQLFITRSTIKSSQNADIYRFYLGPKTKTALARYNDADRNSVGISSVDLDKALDNRILLGWLENILKWLLQLFYRIIPNYGVAIILLTILVKALLWPLTHKSYQSTAKMQTLTPKINALREQYRGSPQKMNQEMAALYKREKVNPASGCLPLLLQFPFFIAMFGLFNNHFDLRGALFIPGWIDDLSAPESIWNFGEFTLPLLNWNDLRLLPIIFVGTQLLTSMLTQNPATTSNTQTKIMAYALPIVFFFILYNMPSGLLVYWIVTNILTAFQQYYNNKIKPRMAHKQIKA